MMKAVLGVVLVASAPVVWPASIARAQASSVEIGDTASALPGIVRVPVAGGNARAGVAGAASAGFGVTESVLATSDVHRRAFGSLAASFRSSGCLAASLRLDGRYDWHSDVPGGDGGGGVGDPRIAARCGADLGSLKIGAELGVWLPGKGAPSVDFAAVSPQLALLAALTPPASPLTLASEVGFRLDRSAHAAPDPDRLARADRLSLGVSDTNALLLGLGGVLRVGSNVEALGEWSWDLRVPPEGVSAADAPMRLDAGARFSPGARKTIQFQLVIEVSTSGRPAIEPGAPLVPVEPRASFFAGVTIRPPLPEPPAVAPPPVDPGAAAASAARTGSVRGHVTGEGGGAVVGARVHVEAPGQPGVDLVPDDRGVFEGRDLPAGKAELRISAEGWQEQVRAVEIAPGKTVDVDVELLRALPLGQIRGLVRSFSGAPISATVRIEPLGGSAARGGEGEAKVAVVGQGGRFELDVPPGSYDVIVKAAGYADQHRHVKVEANGVVVLDLDMRRR
jgi:hypothetical protein